MDISPDHYNIVWSNQQAGKPLIIKQYAERKRFDCERENLPRFSALGFTVPRIQAVDDEHLRLSLEGIEGEVKETLSLHELERCVDVLIEVTKKQQPTNVTRIVGHYIETVRENLTYFARETGTHLVAPRLAGLLADIESCFVASLFKDAKPTNWVIRADAIAMIDFDYVVPSFFLADLAQLLKWQYWDAPHSADTLLERFVRGSLGRVSRGELAIYRKLFPCILANSSIAALRYNHHLSQSVRYRLTQETLLHVHLMGRGETDVI